MNEEEKISELIDRRTALITEDNNNTHKYLNNIDEAKNTDNHLLLHQSRMTTEEILRDIAEEEEIQREHNAALKEVKLFQYIINTIQFYEGNAITKLQLRNIAAHKASTITPDMLEELLDDYVKAGYIRVEEERIYITFLGKQMMRLL